MSENKALVEALAQCRELPSELDDKKLVEWGTAAAKAITNDLACIRADRVLRITVVAAMICENTTVRNYAGYSDIVAFDAIVNRVNDKLQAARKRVPVNGKKILVAILDGVNPF